MARVTGLAHKCGCGSVWCPRCFVQRQAKHHFAGLHKFDWKRTRHIVLTTDRTKFSEGRGAWDYVNTHRKIAGLIRNFKRAYGIKISKWKWFLEWHEDGFPHWHLFIEVEKKGRAGMIGGERIRHYWGLGWAYESFIDGEKHWDFITGYFQRHGYFKSKDKSHQVELPKWAVEDEKLRIRRSGSNAKKRQPPCERIRDLMRANKLYDQIEIIDLQTGEITKEKRKKRKRRPRTYKAMFESCGLTTRIKLMTDHTTMIFKTDIPYKEIREKIPGQYKEGVGYSFNVSAKLFNYLFDKVINVPYFKNARDVKFLNDRIAGWEEVRKERGYFEYSKVYG